jgi:large subunit ribosomal protein L4
MLKGSISSEPVKVKDEVFAKKFNEPLIHQVVEAYRAARRSGTKAQKTRSEARGGGVKPFRQKGTGRARAGTIRSPIWRGGGKAFAAKPRDYSQKVNKKMYASAMRSILSELARQERLMLVENLVDTGKTRDLAKKLKECELEKVLIVIEGVDATLYLSARNLPGVDVYNVDNINPLSLISFEKVLLTKEALEKLEERFV